MPDMRKTQQRRKKLDAFGRMANAVAEFLEEHGWSIVVVGGARVERDPVAKPMTYRFVLDVTGAKHGGKSASA